MGKRDTKSERYRRGRKLFDRLYGEAGAETLRFLEQTAPHLAEYIVESIFGDMFSRPELDLKTRELAVIAALTAMGNTPAQLRAHIGGALKAGCTQQEIIEVIVQTSAYGGIPGAINALQTASEVFATRGKKTRE